MKYAVILLRYLRGYVRIRVTGGFTERFINLCHSKRLNLWDIYISDAGITACISRAHYVRLRPITKKSGVHVSISEKKGLVYKYRKYNKRAGLLTGTALFLALHLFLSMFVWCVDVKGNTDISKSELLTLTQSYGLKAGTLKKSFDEIHAAREIASLYNGKITWLSINIKGSLAIIELREDKKILTQAEDKEPCNIIADFDGVILSAEAYCGDCMVEAGNGVKKGDLLINGAIINEDLSTTFYPSRGKITALHEKKVTYREEGSYAPSSLHIIKRGMNIGFFSLNIPLCIIKETAEDTIILKERKNLCINGYSLPFYREKIILCKKESVKADNNTDSTVAAEKIQRRLYTENANSTITSKNEAFIKADKGYLFTGEYTLIDFIGEEKLILSEESK